MLALPWWATAGLTLLAKVVNQYLANRRAEAALRDLGAATQRSDSLAEAERQEAAARKAGDWSENAADDPDDLRTDL